jgi:hypothetical protein
MFYSIYGTTLCSPYDKFSSFETNNRFSLFPLVVYDGQLSSKFLYYPLSSPSYFLFQLFYLRTGRSKDICFWLFSGLQLLVLSASFPWSLFMLLSTLLSSVADPDPGFGAVLTPGSGIRDEQPGSYFQELRNHFFGVKLYKILKFFDADPGSGMETIRIREPGWKKVG